MAHRVRHAIERFTIDRHVGRIPDGCRYATHDWYSRIFTIRSTTTRRRFQPRSLEAGGRAICRKSRLRVRCGRRTVRILDLGPEPPASTPVGARVFDQPQRRRRGSPRTNPRRRPTRTRRPRPTPEYLPRAGTMLSPMNYPVTNDPNDIFVVEMWALQVARRMNYLATTDPNDIFIGEMMALHVRSVCERIALRYDSSGESHRERLSPMCKVRRRPPSSS
jgi:hypothetical protein